MRFFDTSSDIGIDLGTSNTLLYVKGKGILLNEPSVVAVNSRTRKILAIGSDAKSMIGRTPKDVTTINPLKGGVIADFDLAQEMIKKFIEKVSGKVVFKNSRIAISHPSGVTDVEKRAIDASIKQAGTGKVMLVEEPVAAAIGAGLPINEPVGSMIVNIGGGTTEAAVISLQGIVTNKTLRTAGDDIDNSIIEYVKKEYNLMIGEVTAEKVKIEIGSVFPENDQDEKNIEIKGRDLITGLPRAVIITEGEIRQIIKGVVTLIINAIKDTIEQTPPELAADVMERGIMLSGGGALLRGLDKLIYDELHMSAYIAENPIECVALGTGKCLDMIDKI
ncbi:rod shape-determining protein [Clostridium sp. JN-9]|uniref:rod shape-determining protein n=1 Tax=Clostridium sp. JN-9 TaxID=2507159 RepID=UPI000FFE0920|nr:rod shape-determining protein [Clostridium sp. JN-9]QAT39675.1 rod shape-determining protein [Clostridium sp. JN-9]